MIGGEPGGGAYPPQDQSPSPYSQPLRTGSLANTFNSGWFVIRAFGIPFNARIEALGQHAQQDNLRQLGRNRQDHEYVPRRQTDQEAG